MTPERAQEILGLALGADVDTVRTRYAELHAEYQVRLANAPTAALRLTYQTQLEELLEAAVILAPELADRGSADLPAVTPTPGSDEIYSRTSSALSSESVVRVQKRNRFPTIRVTLGAIAVLAALGIYAIIRNQAEPSKGALLINTDVACRVEIDGQVIGDVMPGSPLRYEVEPAQEHLVRAVPRTGTGEWRQTVDVPAGGQKVMEVQLPAQPHAGPTPATTKKEVESVEPQLSLPNTARRSLITWSQMQSGTTSTLRAVWGTSEDDVWACGDIGTILRFDGVRWKRMTISRVSRIHEVGYGRISIDDVRSSTMYEGFGASDGGVWIRSGVEDYGRGAIWLKFDGEGWTMCGGIEPDYSDVIRQARRLSEPFVTHGAELWVRDPDAESFLFEPQPPKKGNKKDDELGDCFGDAASDLYAFYSWRTTRPREGTHFDGDKWETFKVGLEPNGAWRAQNGEVFLVGEEGQILHSNGWKR